MLTFSVRPFLAQRTTADWITLTSFIPTLFAYRFIFDRQPYGAIVAFSIAFVLDMLDGYIARRTRNETSFGRSLDSFADFFSYVSGSALFLIVFVIPNKNLAMLSAGILLLAGSLRLARFNQEGFLETTDGAYYQGLPVPCIPILIFSLFFALPFPFSNSIIFTLILGLGYLMISHFPVKKRLSSFWIICLILFVWISISHLLAL